MSRVKPPPGTKGPFVPGRGFIRDKRPPPYISFLLRPSPNTWFLICARPAPPTARAEHRRHRRRRRPEPRPHAAAQSPDQPTGDPPEHRRCRNALATIPCSPSTRRYRPSQPTPRLPKGRAQSPESPQHLLHSIEPQNLSLRWEAPASV